MKLLACQPLISLDGLFLLWLVIALHETRSIPRRLSFELEIPEKKKKKSLIQVCSVLWGAGPELTQSFTRLLWRLLPTQGLWQTSAINSDFWKRKYGPWHFSVTHYHKNIFICCSEQADFHMTVLLQWGWITVDFGVFLKKNHGDMGVELFQRAWDSQWVNCL